jgi:hypothetical protein
MAIVQEIIRVEVNNTISFGNYELTEKKKVSDFEFNGDLYKVKTYNEITKLEKNGMLTYESVPGTAVFNFKPSTNSVAFEVAGKDTAQISLELEAEKEYKIILNDVNVGKAKTNLGGKLTFSVEFTNETQTVKIVKL